MDGGLIALILIEVAKYGKLPEEVEQRVTSFGIAWVILLGLFLVVKDTLNLQLIKNL